MDIKSNLIKRKIYTYIIIGVILFGFISSSIPSETKAAWWNCYSNEKVCKFVALGNECTQESDGKWCYASLSEAVYDYESGQAGNALKETGKTVGNIVSYPLVQIIGWILFLIYLFLGKLFAFFGGLMDAVLAIQNFTGVAMVNLGWSIVRDLCNMFFIVIMIIIAFSTVLRIESYGIKKLLWKLIIVALLINFSLLICGALIDASQILMSSFIVSGEKMSLTLAKGAFMHQIFDKEWGITSYGWDILVKMLFGVAILFFACSIFAAISMLLVIRIVAIWLLCIFAPLAWAAHILPGTSSFAKKWWTTFLKYLAYGPTVAFGLFLTTLLINSGGIEKQVQISEASLSGLTGISGWLGGLALPLLNNIFIIVMLYIVLIVARYLGISGASAVTGWATNVGKWGGRAVAGGANRWAARGGKLSLAGGRVGKWMTGKLDTLAQRGKGWERATDIAKAIPKVKRSAVSLFSPTTWKRWSADRKARAEYRAFDEGPGKDTLEALTSGRLAPLKDLATGKANYYSNQAKAREADKKAGEFDKIKDNEKLSDMYWRTSDPREKEGALRVLAKRGAIENELFKGRQDYNPEALQKHFKATFGDEEAARIHADIKAMLIEQGNVGVAGGSKYDKDKHETILVQPGSDDERNIIVEEFSRRPAERSMGNLTKGSIFTLNEKGEPIDIHFQGQTIINSMSDNHISQVKEMREDLLRAMHDHAGLIASIKTDDKDKINKLIEKVKNQYEHGGKAPERPST